MSATVVPSNVPIAEWTRQATGSFINLLQEYPCLWKVKSQHYKNKNLRSLALEKILLEMKQMECMRDVNIENLKRKINTLRSQYRKEKKLELDSKKSGKYYLDQPNLIVLVGLAS